MRGQMLLLPVVPADPAVTTGMHTDAGTNNHIRIMTLQSLSPLTPLTPQVFGMGAGPSGYQGTG